MTNLRAVDPPHFDMAIVGDDLASCLLALAMHTNDPALKLALLSANQEMGGEQLELVLPGCLSPNFADLLKPVSIREWSSYAIRADQRTVVVEEHVCLIDPMQVWLELSQRTGGPALFVGCRDLTCYDGAIAWEGGRIAAASTIDLRPAYPFLRTAQIVEADVLSDLSCPVFADFDAAGDRWHYFQYAPIGADRAVINRIGHALGGRPDTKAPPQDIAELQTMSSLTSASALFDELKRAEVTM